jgi:hypothetical protein
LKNNAEGDLYKYPMKNIKDGKVLALFGFNLDIFFMGYL